MITRIQKALAARRDAMENEKGFTLIELLVVVIIIGILAAIAIPVYVGIQNNAKDSAVQSDVTNLKTALVAVYTQTGSYPSDLTTAANVANLKANGYVTPATANYGATASNLPSVTFATGGTAFCVSAISVTGTKFAASDTNGASKGTCSAAGVFVPAP